MEVRVAATSLAMYEPPTHTTGDFTSSRNSFAGNNVGVALNGTLGATVKENVILSGRAAGVRVNVPAGGNLVAENTLDGNPSGIDFPLTGTAWAVGNTFKENRIANNTCGIKGPTDGNEVLENIFTLNGSDICP